MKNTSIENVEYLYHYTSLSSLALILKNKTIRFNSLINMDDAEEVKTHNSPFLGKYCFISSWTDLAIESIPFWGLYTYNMSGVRIKMRKNPFTKKTLHLSYYQGIKEFESYLPEELAYRSDVYLLPSFPFLRKVEYTSCEELIYPEPIKYLSKNNNGTYDMQGNFNDINRYKRDSWSFQSEWRYGFVILPHDKDGHLHLKLEANTKDLPFDHFDLSISEEAFNDIEILMGPKINSGDKELLKLLCEKYCPRAVIRESELQIN